MAQLELPEYEASPSKQHKGWLVVRCPRPDCDDIFLVRKSKWMKKVTRTTRNGGEFVIIGRSCPYCHRSAAIPARTRIGYN